MKVHQLIDILLNFNQELEVTIIDSDDYETDIGFAIKWSKSPFSQYNHEQVIIVSDNCPASFN